MTFSHIFGVLPQKVKKQKQIIKIFNDILGINKTVDYIFFINNYDVNLTAEITNIKTVELEKILEENENIKQTIIDAINEIDGFCVLEEPVDPVFTKKDKR